MKNLKQVQIPFKKPLAPSFKTQYYTIEVDFRSVGIIRGEEIEVGMLINKGANSRIKEVLEIELVKGRVVITEQRKFRSFSDLDEEWICWEIIKKGELKL